MRFSDSTADSRNLTAASAETRRDATDAQPATLPELLRQRAEDPESRCNYSFTKDGIAVEDSLPVGRLFREASRVAAGLRSRTEPGDRVLIHVEPGLNFVRALFGCLTAGVIAVPTVNGRRGVERRERIRADCGARLMITETTGSRGPGALRISGCTSHGDGDASAVLPLQAPPDADIPHRIDRPVNPGDVCLLQYTSGSTSDPKGVMLTHANLLHNLRVITEAFEATPESRGVIWLPPFHDMGLIGGLLVPLYAGFPVRLMSPRSFVHRPVRWLRAVSTFRATISGGPAFAWDHCTRRIRDSQLNDIDLSSWKVAFCGAEPIRAEILEQFAERFAEHGFRRQAFYPCYGLAESSLMVSGGRVADDLQTLQVSRRAIINDGRLTVQNDPRGDIRRIVSCGFSRGQTVQIVDPDTRRLCDEGEIGEICVAGESVALGYWNRPALTRSVFRTSPSDHEQSCLATGDLGAVRKDQLYVVGRRKDLLIVNGLNIPAEDVEDVCARSHPLIQSGCCAAIASSQNDKEHLTLLVELSRHVEDTAAASVVESATSAVHGAYGRVGLCVLPVTAGSLPRTSSGKLRRTECRNQLESGGLQIRSYATADDSRSSAAGHRTGRALLDAVSPFAVERPSRSWRELWITLCLLCLLLGIAAIPAVWLPLRILTSVTAGVLLVRMFILYHDFQHGAIFRHSPLARGLLSLFGLLTLTPPRNWRFSHNFHHARNSQFATSEIGSFPIMTTDQFAGCSRWQRLRYLAARSPLMMLAGYPAVFLIGFCFRAMMKDPRRYWDSGVALGLHAALLLILTVWGSDQVVWCYLVPLAISMTIGSYLFYVQHNFPDVKLKAREHWDFEFAALHSSSFLDVHPVFHWLTGNIGFHHIHHLNSRIPFYRLPEAFHAIPELQSPGRTNLSPREIARCLSLKLWDPRRNRMISLREFRSGDRCSPVTAGPVTPLTKRAVS